MGILVGYVGVPPILATLATMSVFTVCQPGSRRADDHRFPGTIFGVANETVVGFPIRSYFLSF